MTTKLLRLTFCIGIFFACPSLLLAQEQLAGLYKLATSESPPTVYDRIQEQGEPQSFYFEGARYRGKATRIFAYYDIPLGTGPFPAIVLVHGGGGSAYKEWVKKWNDAGFAAISIAVEGQTATGTGKRPPEKWVKHRWGGPRRPGIYNDAEQPLTDQWMYHATSAVISAHNLLRSFKAIKKHQIGVTGISWGGVITSTVIGFDQRFAFAIPIYGCGYLNGMDNHYKKALKDNANYRDVWEPALRIARYEGPTFWLTGLKENNFALDAQAKTYQLLKGEHRHSIQPKLRHSHKAGWTPRESYVFAQSVINGQALPSFHNQNISRNKAHVEVIDTNEIASASLIYTFDLGFTGKRTWHQGAVKMTESEEKMTLSASLPVKATAWFFNIEEDGLIYSSAFSERASGNR